ncbi:MAG: sigma-70 family RNA polymerase sigma factor [Tannerellaceae bacterium]|nr:sigma-70 family RNA polymerase sigma factor [Tannerellaceae bacterium]
MPEINDNVWIRCLKGDLNAFQELYDFFYPLLFNYGKRYVNDPEIVKDCIQDLFIKLIQNHQTLSPTGNLKGYMLKAFRFKLYDYLEKQNPHEPIENYKNAFHTEDLFLELFRHEAEPGTSLYFLAKAFRQLPETQQEIIYLYYIQELTHKEIAELTNIHYQSSKTHLYRAIHHLKNIYFDLIHTNNRK